MPEVATLTSISAVKLREKLESDDRPVLINVLGRDAYRAERIPGSINIPSDHVEDMITEVVPDKQQDIVVYCADADCSASPEAAHKLEDMGYTRVMDFEAGLAGWKNAGYKTINNKKEVN